MPMSFELRKLDIKYEAEFSPPIVELASAEAQPRFIRGLLEKFELKFGDLIVNPQSLSHNMVSFTKYSPEGGFFNISIGVDAFSNNYFNVLDRFSAWDASLKVLQTISTIVKIPFAQQMLTFNAHCYSEITKSIDLIDRYNTFSPKNEILKSKGVSFLFNGPLDDSEIFFILGDSLLIPDGLLIMSQITFRKGVKQYENIYEISLKYLEEKILPMFDINIITQEEVKK